MQPPSGPAPEFLKRSQKKLGVAMQYDVVLCGGTLGIFLATALQLAGHRWFPRLAAVQFGSASAAAAGNCCSL